MSGPSIGQRRLLDIALGEPNVAMERVLEAIPGGLVIVAVDGSVRAANRAACEMLGLAFDQLTRRYTSDFAPETIWEDGTPCAPDDYPVSRVLATGEPQPAATIGVRRPDGTLCWAVFRAVDLRDPETDELAGALVTFLDVTERKRAQEELEEKQSWLAQAQQIARIGTWRWDLATGALFWSDEMHAIWGTYPKTFQPTWEAVMQLVHDEDRLAVHEMAEQASGSTGSHRMEFRIGLRDGTIRQVWAEGLVRVDERGRPVRMIGILQDVTERLRDEDRRRDLTEQLRQSQKMESIGQLAGGVAHDFNNLIQVMLGNTDICLAPGIDDARRRDSLGEIRRSAERAAELTRQLLAFSRRQQIRPANIDLNDLLSGLVKMLRRLLGERIELTFLPESPLGAVHADPSQLEQVILNLCVNARDAMPDGGHITIATRSEDTGEQRHVLIRVSDTGHGISREASARVFEPFFTTKAQGQGTGLGLSVVYGIVKQHGGAVEFWARPEGGTTFEVRLPQSATAAMRRPAQSPSRAPGGTETVLVVEDEDMVRRLTIRVLEDAGYHVLSATNGREALSVFDAAHGVEGSTIDLVLLDLVMPELGGDALYGELKIHAPQLKFLFTSGYPLNRDIDELIQQGVPALMKPYGADALLRKVREILSG